MIFADWSYGKNSVGDNSVMRSAKYHSQEEKKSKAPMQDRDKLVTGSHTAGKGSVGQSQSVLRLCYWCIMIVREVFSIKLKRLFPLVLRKLHLQYYIQFWKLKWYRHTGQSKAAEEIWKIWSGFFLQDF